VRKVVRSALVPYPADRMYALVEDIAAYPEFLPWCTGATVHSRDSKVVEASLDLQRGLIRKTFRTLNTLSPGSAIGLELIGGPFRHLSGGWRFEQLGDDGCKVSLDLEFEFESRITDALFGSYLEEICSSLIESFIRRAQEIYP